jgi:hypothetical protein
MLSWTLRDSRDDIRNSPGPLRRTTRPLALWWREPGVAVTGCPRRRTDRRAATMGEFNESLDHISVAGCGRIDCGLAERTRGTA